jgi:hypothetical protein
MRKFNQTSNVGNAYVMLRSQINKNNFWLKSNYANENCYVHIFQIITDKY